jgi:hypothetical protein
LWPTHATAHALPNLILVSYVSKAHIFRGAPERVALADRLRSVPARNPARERPVRGSPSLQAASRSVKDLGVVCRLHLNG